MKKKTPQIIFCQNQKAVVCEDFETFCEYLLNKKIKLSPKTGFIGKYDSFKINSLFYIKEDYEKATRFQCFYPIIDYFYYTALKYQILEISLSGTSMQRGKYYQIWHEAPWKEQYMILFLNLLFDDKFLGECCTLDWYLSDFFDQACENELSAGKICHNRELLSRLLYSDKKKSGLRYLEEFSLIKVLEKDEQGRILSFEVLPFLMPLIQFLDSLPLKYTETLEGDELIQKYFFKYLKMTPGDEKTGLTALFEEPAEEDYTGSIDLHVGLRGWNCYRVIRLNLDDSLSCLHTMIQEAFDFGDDHLYAFYIGHGMMRKVYTPCEEEWEEELSAYDTCLGELRLRKGQKFTYLFDFGFEWWFDIKVKQTQEDEVPSPEIIKYDGDAPDQYDPDW